MTDDDRPLPGYVDRILDGDRRRKKERRKAKRRGEPALDSSDGLHFELAGYGEIVAYRSPIDGVLVIEIDTPEATFEARTADFDTRPLVRVYINDDVVWENPAIEHPDTKGETT